MKHTFLLFLLLPFASHLSAQDSLEHRAAGLTPIETLNDKLYKSSNRYVGNNITYRVIKWSTLNAYFEDIKRMDAEKSAQIERLSLEIKDLENKITEGNSAYDELKLKYEAADNIKFMNLLVSKQRYKLIMLSILALLLITVLLLYVLFKNSKKVTVDAQKELKGKEEEFESYRRRTLKREQEVASGYVREINKLKEKLTN